MNRNINIKVYEGNLLLSAYDTVCILEDDFLSFNTDDDNIRINLNNFSFTKENNDSILKITNNRCTLTLKEINKSLDIDSDYINYTNDNNKNIIIEYKLISQDVPIKVELNIGSVINEI